MNYYEKRAVKNNLRIDMYFKINAVDGLFTRSEQITFSPNESTIDKCAEEISRVYGGDVNDEDINNIKKIINKYINLSKKGGE